MISRHDTQRFRRHRILGLLPALVLVSGGLYLGLSGLGWVGLVIGAVFLVISTLMIITDRPTAQSAEIPVASVDMPSTLEPSTTSSMDDESTEIETVCGGRHGKF